LIALIYRGATGTDRGSPERIPRHPDGLEATRIVDGSMPSKQLPRGRPHEDGAPVAFEKNLLKVPTRRNAIVTAKVEP